MRPLCLSKERDSFYVLMDEEKCYEILRRARWPDGHVQCPYCGSQDIAGPWRSAHAPGCYRYRC